MVVKIVFVGLEDLKLRKADIMNVIKKEEADKAVLEKNIRVLQEKLTVLNNSLVKHKNLYENYDRTIKETETGFKKVDNKTAFNYFTLIYSLFTDPRKLSDFIKFSTTRSTQIRKYCCL